MFINMGILLINIINTAPLNSPTNTEGSMPLPRPVQHWDGAHSAKFLKGTKMMITETSLCFPQSFAA
ncbi:hypothetical protein GDO86_014730 [Hymenochirus boettgeri]|uniref:Uncharacterized protein n=1 Tax=Hymenochirus boettgeri TaxID=247094 RepID=A0A8T2JVE6_9PIPI|nr:hypothetical protein GDO86_014730 [Hymenochirus boettgeri]